MIAMLFFFNKFNQRYKNDRLRFRISQRILHLLNFITISQFESNINVFQNDLVHQNPVLNFQLLQIEYYANLHKVDIHKWHSDSTVSQTKHKC